VERHTNWYVATIILMAIPAIAGLKELWQWLSPNAPQVEIYYHSESVNLPQGYWWAIRDLNSDFGVKGSLAILRKEGKEYPVVESIETLRSVKSLRDWVRPQVGMLHILNVGEKPANNLKVIFPDAAYVEIRQEGKDIIKKEIPGQVDIGVLHPDVAVDIDFWAPNVRWYLQKMRAPYDEGRAELIESIATRRSGVWVIEFPWKVLLGIFWLFGSIVLFSYFGVQLVRSLSKTVEHKTERKDSKQLRTKKVRRTKASRNNST
jgi:hypothetical protein